MENVSWLTDLFNNFALPIVMIIVFIVGIVALFKYYAKRDENHDSEVRELTEKYYQSYTQVTESNVKVAESNVRVAEALNNNTRIIEKLMDKLDK